MKLTLTLFVVASATLSNAIAFDDLAHWTGTGANRSGLVVQWETSSGPRALAWGFRHNGGTVESMFKSIARTTFPNGVSTPGADGSLFAFGEQFSFGYGIYGIGFDLNGSGVNGSGFNYGGVIDSTTALDASDYWNVGWLTNGYWALFEGASGTGTSTWYSAATGVSGLSLQNDGWYALAFAPSSNGWSTSVSSNILAAPVPEPATLLILGGGLMLSLKRRRISG